jgi:hypothetical protein
LLAGINTSLLGLVFNTSARIDKIGVVADQSIAGVLGDDTKGYKEHETITVATGLQKIKVAAVCLGLVLHGNSLLHLVVLELDSRVGAVAIGMILGKNVESLVGALLSYKPTGRLGNPPDDTNLDKRGNALDDGDCSPGPVVFDVDGAKGNESAD